MITFEEYLLLLETPQGHHGEWDGGSDTYLIGHVPSDNYTKKLIKLGSLGDVEFYINSNSDTVVGIDTKINVIVLHMLLGNFEISTINKEFPQTNMIRIAESHKNLKLASTLYSLLLDRYGALVCDYDQFDGARALWKSFGRKDDLYKYTYNEIEDVLTPINNFDNESQLWSFDKDEGKRYLLLVVSKNKLRTH